MIEARARVVACDGKRVTLEAIQQSSCDQCSDKECGNGQVNRALSKRYHHLVLPVSSPLLPGDEVILEIPEQGLLTAAGLMFVLPLLMLMMGALLGQWLLVSALDLHELWVVLSSFLGGGVGYKLATIWHPKLNQRHWFEPRIARVITPELQIHSA